ncbi:MAG: hypothetical protein QW057_01695 [Candidatus Bathyarchaeia archaeon]
MKVGAGVRAGSLSGALMGLIGALIGVPLILASSNQEWVTGRRWTPEGLTCVLFALNAVGATLLGSLLGAFYGRLYGRLPGSSSIRKALPFGLAALVVEGPLMMIVTWFPTLLLMQLTRVGIDLAGSLAFTVLLASLYDRFVKTDMNS